jgi:uncharacterized membrane protein YbhN (UPF0104 family)
MDRLKRVRSLPAWTLPVLRWVLGIGLVAFLLARFNLAEVGRTLAGADLRLAIPGIIGLVAVHLLGAATWRMLAARLGDHRLGWRRTVRTYYIAQGLGSLTPANLGSDAYRAVAVAGEGARWRDGLLPIVVQRITASAALATLGVIAAARLPDGVDLVPVVAGAAGLLVIGSSLVLLLLRRPGNRPAGVTGPGAWAGSTAPRRQDLAGASVLGLALGVLFHAASIGLSLILVASLGEGRDPAAVVAALAVARLSILVPISPSGLGVQEGALSLLFMRIGLPAEVALAAALLNRVALVATVALGTVLLASGRGVRPTATRGAARGRDGTSSLPIGQEQARARNPSPVARR